MKPILISRRSRFIPNRESKEFHRRRNLTYTPDKFDTYNDWFYFIHIDRFTRRIHALGMLIGLAIYSFALYRILTTGEIITSALIFLIGVFFFFFLPLLSHYFYDGGGAKSTPDHFHSTLLPVIHINLMTLTGRFDPWLRKFVAKYPFVIEAWELEERSPKD